MLELDSTLAQHIVDRAMAILPHNINVMDAQGMIIGSGDRERLHSRHEGAQLVLANRRTVEIDAQAAACLRGVKPGVNLPLLYADQLIGVLGITGDPEVLRPYAALVRMTAEMLVEQRQRAGLADAEAREVGKLRVLRVGVVEADEEHRDDLAAGVAHRGVLGHVEALEEQRAADVVLPGEQALVGRVRVVEHGADGAAAVLLVQRGGDPDEIRAIADEHRGHAGGELAEFVDLSEIVVQHLIVEVQRRRFQRADRDALVGIHTKTAGEALLEQAGEALGALAQAAVEGRQLVGEQPRLAGQVLLAGGEVGVIQRAQGEQRAGADHHHQNQGQGHGELPGNAGFGLRHVISHGKRGATDGTW